MDRFPQEIHEKLGWYVYRLIDPRTGMTFYVGKGQKDRIFEHVRGSLKDDESTGEADLKNRTIIEIHNSRLPVLHIIHRHGLETEEIAYEVEAALMDAYSGLTNVAGGHGSIERGCRHVDQVVTAYQADPLEAKEPLILIHIGRSLSDGADMYQGVRGMWRMSMREAEKRKLVLADDGILVRGAYRPARWLAATKANFPHLLEDQPDRIGFEGVPADDVWSLYVGRRVPKRRKGSVSPFRYIEPS